jgi:NAD(P)-dependent dehydrogenase (short-subunit alcohol dehydrogenase family)
MGVGIPTAGFLGYTAAKHGVIGLMRSWANFLAPHNIRVNSVAPTAVRTPMAGDGNLQAIVEHAPELARALSNAMPVDLVEPLDVSHGIAWLVSDEARYVTGTVVPVDAGRLNKR